MGAHANVANIRKNCVKYLRNSKFSKDDTGGLYESMLTRPFHYVQIDLTERHQLNDGYAYGGKRL